MTKCKRFINGKCWGYDGINCSEYCPGYDENFDARQAVMDMVKFGLGRGMKEDVRKAFNLAMRDFGDQAESIIGTTDVMKFWEVCSDVAVERKPVKKWSREDTDKATELRKAGLSLRMIGAQTGHSYSTVQKYLKMAGVK